MMKPSSALFHLSPDSWLGQRLDSGKQEIVTPRKALSIECRPNKREPLDAELKLSLERELAVIDGLPESGCALRGDRVEVARAADSCCAASPSVDICIRAGERLMLVECKYRAMPETSIVKDVTSFNDKITRKFEASLSFYRHEGASGFYDERIVLFNADSKDKVVSMFQRLVLEEEGAALRQYQIMDTQEFANCYRDEGIYDSLSE